MPLKIATTAPVREVAPKARPTTSVAKPAPAPQGQVAISRMGALEGFKFTSAVKPENTGFYIRCSSKETKALNLQNGKVIKFGPTELGTIVNLDVTESK